MASNFVPSTTVLYVFLSAVLSVPFMEDDDTWMAMLKPLKRPEIAWCPSVIVAPNWVFSDQECAISATMEPKAVAGVRLWTESAQGQERMAQNVIHTPFGRLRAVHLVAPFEFNENVSFIRLAENDLPQFGLPCRASGATSRLADERRRLVSQTVIAMPVALCKDFGVAHVQTCARSYPRHYPCSAPPPVWLSCQRLLTGWCYFSRPCSVAYQTHLGHAVHPTITWMKANIPGLPEPGQVMISSQPPAFSALLLPLLVPLQGALSYLLTATSSPRTA